MAAIAEELIWWLFFSVSYFYHKYNDNSNYIYLMKCVGLTCIPNSQFMGRCGYCKKSRLAIVILTDQWKNQPI